MIVISCISQKGGVGKSTIARMLAVSYAKAGWTAKIADMDISQGTVTSWNARRMQNKIEPGVSVEQYNNVNTAVRQSQNFDVLIFDGAPHSSKQTLQIAKASGLVIIPTGTALDDLIPTINLANELIIEKIERDQIVIVFNRVGSSKAELREAKEYVDKAGFMLARGELPERTIIRRAQDEGYCANETKYDSVNENSERILKTLVGLIY